MKCEILGKKQSKWIDKDTGEARESAKLFVAHRHPADNQASTFEGRGCSVVPFPVDYYPKLHVGGEVDLDFDTEGKLLEIIIED